MTILRTAVAVWIASLVGVASTLAFFAFTGPFGPRLLDGLIAGAIFAAGCAAGFVAARRMGNLLSLREPHPVLSEFATAPQPHSH